MSNFLIALVAWLAMVVVVGVGVGLAIGVLVSGKDDE